MDPLSDVLRALQLSGVLVFRADLRAPWSYQVPPARTFVPALLPQATFLVCFHLVASGPCSVVVRGRRRTLEPGEAILLPHGDAHVFQSGPGLRPVPVPVDPAALMPSPDGELASVVHPGSGPETTMLCGFLAYDGPMFEPLQGALPEVIVDGSRPWFEAISREVLQPAGAGPHPGAGGIRARFVELMFLEVLRRYVAAMPPDQVGWLAALRDPQVGRAVAALHGDPASPWTVEALARRAGLSRTALADRFRSVMGISPMQYLAMWRLQLASRLLRRSDLSIAQAAAQVGYQSEAAFHRAFKRRMGEPPARWRARTGRGSESTSPRAGGLPAI